MKPIKVIQDELDRIQVFLSTEKKINKSTKTKIKKRHIYLVICKSYLQSGPTQDFLEKEKDRLLNKINMINAGHKPDEKVLRFLENEVHPEKIKELKKRLQGDQKEYNSLMGMKKWKEQLKAIKFILEP